MASQPSSPSPFGSRPTPSSSTPSAFQPPATTHAPHVPHPLSARLPIGVGGSNTSGSGSLPSSLPSTLPSRLNTVSPPPTPTSPILRSTSPPISGSVSNTRLRPSPLLGTTPLPGNRSSSTHAGGILPPASFFRPTGSNSAGRARGQSITSPASPGGSVVPTSLPFKSTSSPSGERTSALPTTMGGLTPGKKLPIGEVRGSNMGSLSKAPLLPFSGSSSAPAPTSAIGGVRGSFERLFWKRSSSGAGGNGGNGAHRDEEAEVGSIGKRSSKRISVDDLGDGPSGGGVVMEMGRIAEFSQLEVGEGWKERNRSRVEDVHEDEEEIDAEGHVRERRNSFLEREQMGKDGFAQSSNYQRQHGSQGDFLDVDTRVEPEPHTATTDTMTESVHKPPIPRIETHPSENEAHGTPVSRHARFAPSPPRSAPTQQSNNDAQAKQSSPSWSIFHWRRNPIPIPSYLIPVFSGKNSKTLRNYKFHPSRNRYLFKGHLITGGDSAWPFVGALTVVLGIAGVWFGSTCVWWWRRGDGGQAVAGVGAYLCLLTITSMLMTATRDPGILPRDLDPDPPYPQTTTTASDSSPPVPLPRDLRVRNGTVRVKYCVTCKTYRPPRSSHCKMCDNCVDGCDHHCQWVNNCVGRRNYTYFITFVVTASITLLLVLVTAFLHIYYLTQDEGYNVRGALKHAPGSAVALGMGIVVIWPLLALTLYHVRLLLLNITTIEQVRNQAHRKLTKSPTPPNPFTTGRWYRNVAYLVCRPAGYSWVDLSGVALHDSRKVNPGFVVSQVGGSGGRTSESTRDDGEGERWKRSEEYSAR